MTGVDMSITQSIGDVVSVHWSVPDKDIFSVVERHRQAQRIYNRYLKAKGGIPYALRFKAWCKKWGIEL